MISLDIVENGENNGGTDINSLRSSVIALSNSVVNININTSTLDTAVEALSTLNYDGQISSLSSDLNSLSLQYTAMTESIGYISDSIIQVSDSLSGLVDSLSSLSADVNSLSSQYTAITGSIDSLSNSIIQLSNSITGLTFTQEFNNQYNFHCNDTFMLKKIPDRGNLLALSLTSGYMEDTFTLSNKTYDTLYLSGTPLNSTETIGLGSYTVLDNCSFNDIVVNNFVKISATLGGGLLWGKSNSYADVNTFDFVDCTPTHDDSRQLFYRYMNISELNFYTNGRCMYPFVDCNISSVSIKPWVDGFLTFKGDTPFRAAMSDCNISTLKAYYGLTDSLLPKGRLFAKYCTINSLKIGYPILSNATAAENFLCNCTFNRPESGGSYTILLKESESTLWANSSSNLTRSFRDFVVNPNLSNSYFSATFTLPTYNTTHTTLTMYDFPCTTELYA